MNTASSRRPSVTSNSATRRGSTGFFGFRSTNNSMSGEENSRYFASTAAQDAGSNVFSPRSTAETDFSFMPKQQEDFGYSDEEDEKVELQESARDTKGVTGTEQNSDSVELGDLESNLAKRGYIVKP